jgi:hypothetical protein
MRFQVTQHLRGSNHIAAVVGLKDRPGMQSLIGESSAICSSSGSSKFVAFATLSVQSICVLRQAI